MALKLLSCRPSTRAILLFACSIVSLLGPQKPALAQSTYTLVQIDPGYSPATDINDAGQVVGYWQRSVGSQLWSFGYRWTLGAGA
jgi:hypothetical protein